jgi:hypothetical protein
MVRTLGLITGVLFLVGGALGFVPGITSDGMFLGVFMVNTAHSIVHIVSGAVFLIASTSGARLARLWFQLFGAVYAVVATAGFIVGDGMIFGVISNNRFDSWGHAVLALVMLLIGFWTGAGQPRFFAPRYGTKLTGEPRGSTEEERPAQVRVFERPCPAIEGGHPGSDVRPPL